MLRIVAKLHPAETRRGLRTSREDYRHQLHAARIANRALAEQVAALIAERDTRPALPAPIQALVDWYLRKPVTAVLDLPKRASVQAALDEWQAGHDVPDGVLAFPKDGES
jgi:hypothetical protein